MRAVAKVVPLRTRCEEAERAAEAARAEAESTLETTREEVTAAQVEAYEMAQQVGSFSQNQSLDSTVQTVTKHPELHTTRPPVDEPRPPALMMPLLVTMLALVRVCRHSVC